MSKNKMQLSNKELDTNKKPSIVKVVFLWIFIVILVFMESLLLPSLISSSFINKNTAGYMVFDVDMEEGWLQSAEYSWIDIDETYKTYVNEEYSVKISDIMISTYGKSHYIEKISYLLNEQTGIDTEESISILMETKLAAYMNEFVQMQAGHLVGDNIPPTPKMDDLDQNMTTAIALLDDEATSKWYEEHRVELNASIKDAMMASNDKFSVHILETDPVFGESCLILKVLNLLILFYTNLAIVIILTFFIFTALKTRYTWYALAGANIVSAIISVFTYLGLKDVNLVVFNVPYSPTQEMINDCILIEIILAVSFLVFAGICIAVEKIKPKKFSQKVINRFKH
jgi:hypothetical protein